MSYPTAKVVFDRKHKATKKKTGLVQIEVLHGRKKKTISTDVKVYAGQWKDATMVSGRTDAFELNERINLILSEVREFINSLIKEKQAFSFDKLQNYIDTKCKPSDSFLDFVEKRIEERKIKESTKRQHRAMLARLREFGKIKTFDDLILKNIKLLDDYEKKFANMQTTVYAFHKRVKVYVKEAYEYDLIERNPYEKFKVKRGEHRVRQPLTGVDEQKIMTCKILDASIENVRDAFMFCRWTGLAYADLLKFDFKKVIKENNRYMIIDARVKTNTPFRLTLLSPAMAILQKHNFVLPTMTNQQFNMRLKVLASYAGVDRKLTSHIARHTFATWALSNGVSIETLSKMLGHKDIRTTQVYAKVLQLDVSKGYGKLQKELSIGEFDQVFSNVG